MVLLAVALLCGCGDSTGSGEGNDVPIPVAPASPDAGSGAKNDVSVAVTPPSSDAGSSREPASADARKKVSPADNGKTTRQQFGQVRLDIPAGWHENELSGARATILDASYGIPDADPDIEVTFSRIGGGIPDNLSRWEGQFVRGGSEPVRRTMDVDGTDASWIEITGTFTARAAGNPGPHEDWMLLGAAIPLAGNDFYIKLTGPREAVLSVRDELQEMVKSVRIGG